MVMIAKASAKRRRTKCDAIRRNAVRRARRHSLVGPSLLLLGISLFSTEVSALRCFSCRDCSAGGVLSARMQQCTPEEHFCATTVHTPRVGSTGPSSPLIDRGCASSITAMCSSDETPKSIKSSTEGRDHHTYLSPHTKSEETRDRGGENADGIGDNEYDVSRSLSRTPPMSSRPPPSSSQSQPPPSIATAATAGEIEQGHTYSRRDLCCSTDLCNGPVMSGRDAATGAEEMGNSYRRSQEHRRDLMEGTRSSSAATKQSVDGVVWRDWGQQGVGNNSATKEGGGSRLATVLVIVGTFAQALWLAGSFLQ